MTSILQKQDSWHNTKNMRFDYGTENASNKKPKYIHAKLISINAATFSNSLTWLETKTQNTSFTQLTELFTNRTTAKHE